MAFFIGNSWIHFFQVISDTTQAQGMIMPPAPVSRTALPLPDMNTVASMGWFGNEQAVQHSDDSSAIILAQLELKGVVNSGKADSSGAFVAEKGKPEIYYPVGGELPLGAGTLKEVFGDHITISQGMAVLSLRFPAKDTAFPQ